MNNIKEDMENLCINFCYGNYHKPEEITSFLIGLKDSVQEHNLYDKYNFKIYKDSFIFKERNVSYVILTLFSNNINLNLKYFKVEKINYERK